MLVGENVKFGKSMANCKVLFKHFHYTYVLYLEAICQIQTSEFATVFCYIYVTGYWKTNHVLTFGQLLFIGPDNSHTHTLPVPCCINGLS